FILLHRAPSSSPVPYPTLFRSCTMPPRPHRRSGTVDVLVPAEPDAVYAVVSDVTQIGHLAEATGGQDDGSDGRTTGDPVRDDRRSEERRVGRVRRTARAWSREE